MNVRGLEAYLNARVIGQQDALSRISRAIEAADCNLNARGPRPKGSFLFMGSRGIARPKRQKRLLNMCLARTHSPCCS